MYSISTFFFNFFFLLSWVPVQEHGFFEEYQEASEYFFVFDPTYSNAILL